MERVYILVNIFQIFIDDILSIYSLLGKFECKIFNYVFTDLIQNGMSLKSERKLDIRYNPVQGRENLLLTVLFMS